MGRGLSGDHPVLEFVLEQWPALIFLPSVFALIGVLVGVTAWWERRDRATAARKSAQQNVVAAPPRTAAAATRSTPRAAGRRAWWGQARCTCSWHAAPDGTTPAPAAARRAA